MHVITGRAGALDALLAAGFVRGIDPATTPIGEMHELTPLLRQTISSVARPTDDDVSGIAQTGTDAAERSVSVQGGN